MIVAIILIGFTPVSLVRAASVCVMAAGTANGVNSFGVGNGTTNHGGGNGITFTPASNCTLGVNSVISSVQNLVGTPADNLITVIYNTSAGAPSTILCTANPFVGLTGTAQNLTTGFSSTCNLTGGVTYAIIWTRSGAASNANFFGIGGDNSGGSVTLYNDGSYVSSFSPITGWTPPPYFELDNTVTPVNSATSDRFIFNGVKAIFKGVKALFQ